MQNQASYTNVNAANVQLYGGRKVLPQSQGGNSPVGQIASTMPTYVGNSFNEYLKGLSNLAGAGDRLAHNFYDIMAAAAEREATSKLSKAYRDKWMQMMTSEDYFGRGSLYMMKDWEQSQERIFDKFVEDNKERIPRGIMRRVADNLNDQYANRIGATQVQRANEWDHKTRIEMVNEVIDTAVSTASVGDMKSLEQVKEAAEKNFSHDPVMARSLTEQGFKSVMTAWRDADPSGFISWSNKNMKGLEKLGGASGVAHVGNLVRQAQAEARAIASFKMSQANFAWTQQQRAKQLSEERTMEAAMKMAIDDPSKLSLDGKIDGASMSLKQLLAQNPQRFMMMQRAMETATGTPAIIPGLNDNQKVFLDLSKGIYTKDPTQSMTDINLAYKHDRITMEQHQKALAELKAYGKSRPEIIDQMNTLKTEAIDGNADMQQAIDLMQRGYLDAEGYAQINKVNENALDITNIVGSAAQYKVLVEPVKQSLVKNSGSLEDQIASALAGEGSSGGKDSAGIALFAQYQNSIMQLAKEMKQNKVPQAQIINELDAMKPGTVANLYYKAIKANEEGYRNEFGIANGMNAKVTPGQQEPLPAVSESVQTRMGGGYELARNRIKVLNAPTPSAQSMADEAF